MFISLPYHNIYPGQYSMFFNSFKTATIRVSAALPVGLSIKKNMVMKEVCLREGRHDNFCEA